MERVEETVNSESTEDTKANDSVKTLRQVDEDSVNINLRSSSNRMLDSELSEKIIEDGSGVLIFNDDRDTNESNEVSCEDSRNIEKSDVADESNLTADVSFGTDDVDDAFRNKTVIHTGVNDVVEERDETDIHIATNNEVEGRDGNDSVDCFSETMNRDINYNPSNSDYIEADKCIDSVKATVTRHKELLKDDNESCDLPDSETDLLVESISSNNNVSDLGNDEDADTAEGKTLKSSVEENENIDILLKTQIDESESLDGIGRETINSEERATESQNVNQKKDSSLSCLDDSSTLHFSEDKNNSDKPNSDSDMEIDNDDGNSDPEFLSSKFPNESDADGSGLSSTKCQKPTETEVSKLECEAQINEDIISGTLLAPEDVIIECKDKKNFFYCNVCHCNIHNSTKNVKVHKKGKSHKAAMIKYKKSVVMFMKNITSLDKSGPHLMFLDCYIERYKPRGYYCRVCNFIAEKFKAMDDHVHGKWHETNICIMKAREIIAQQKDNPEKGTKDEMKELDEEYYKILESSRLKSWNSYSAAIAEDVSKMKTSCYNIQDPSLYSDSQGGFPQNQYYQNFTMNQDTFSQSPALVDPSVNSDASVISQMGNSQQMSLFSQSQQNPVADASEIQQTKISTPSQSQENNSRFDVQFLITRDSDAEIVIEVINSLLQTYLKYKLDVLPKSLFKLPCNSNTEELVSRFATSRIPGQSFHNLQNSKNRYQSAISANDKRPSPNLYRSRSMKRTYTDEASSSKKLHDLSMDYKNYRPYKSSLMEDKADDSYHNVCPEDQMRKPITSRSIDIMRQNEDNFSRNLKEAESIIDELCQYRSSYKDVDPQKRIRHSKSFADDAYRKFKNYDEADVPSRLTKQNESADYSFLKQYKQNESFMNDLSQQYQHFKKDISARSSKQLEPHNTDFSDVYIRGCNTEDRYSRKPNQNAQSISHLVKTFRSSSNFSYY